MEITDAPFGDLLRSLRHAAALSQEELAEQAGLSVRGIADLERGARRTPRAETLRLLAEALRLDAGQRQQFALAARLGAISHQAPAPLQGVVGAPRRGLATFGREADRAGLRALLTGPEAADLVTITGPGGVGKTHLALHTAATVHSDFRDGAFFVDLSPITGAQHVLPAIASALGLDDAAGVAPLSRLTARLRGAEMLLVLDNCEQVLAAAPEIAALLDACPGLTLLATSRAALGIRGERRWPLEPLSLPDSAQVPPLPELAEIPAVALFVARARNCAPHFALTAENAAAVVSICQQLDGLPLAIELAAARIAHLAPAELAARLHRRLPLLTTGARDGPARQRTLRAAIAWSYDLLAPAEQQLVRWLGVCAGGWDVAAAAAVAGTAADGDSTLLDRVGALIDANLVRVTQRDGATRYTMLETIREFALEALATSGDAATARRRHAEHFLHLAEQGEPALMSAGQRAWLLRLEAELPNLRAALATFEEQGDHAACRRLAHALGLFWFMNARAAEGLPITRRLLPSAPPESRERAHLLVRAGMLAFGVGDYAAAIADFAAITTILHASPDSEITMHALLVRGVVAEHLGDETLADECYLRVVALAQERNDVWALSEALPNLSDAAYRRGDLALAERYAQEAMAPLRAVGHDYMLSMNFGNLAQVALARGEVTAAAALVDEALASAVTLWSRWNLANVIAFGGAIAAAQGQHARAARLLGAADAVRVASGHPRMPHFALFAQTSERVRAALGAGPYGAHWEDGQAVSLAAALAETRAVLAAASATL